jgi:two-component system LytT family response regulator
MTDETAALRAVIVDDEAPARAIVREELEAIGGVTIVAECANGFDAVKVVAEETPDLVLLDIQMPKLDGFEVLELIGRDVAVVFITAHDDYAIRAFEVHAVDYLMKPFSRDRLERAIARVRARQGSAEPGVTPAELRAAARPPGTPLDRVVIRDGPHVHVLSVDKIDFVEAQDDYVAFHSGARTFTKEQTISTVETQLDARRFVRIHRSYLLNIDRLSKVELYAKDSRLAILVDGRKLPVSRSGYQRLQVLL